MAGKLLKSLRNIKYNKISLGVYLKNELIKTFCDLVRIPSPSGIELNTARYIQSYLKQIGIKSYMDDSGKIINSNAGNVIAKIGKGQPKIMFVAHMDTVEDGKKIIKPVIKRNIVSSDGTTILGSDDKAGVAALLEAVKELRCEKNLPAFLCIFCTREENGDKGANHLDVDKRIGFVFDVDGSYAPGNFINKALGDVRFEIHIYGKEAHAASNPDKGLNAIKTAGIIISKLKLGRDSRGRTLNIGSITGGRMENVIPEYALLKGETRAFRIAEIYENLRLIESVAKKACRMTGCKYKFFTKELNAPLYTEKTEKIVRLAKKATLAAGLRFKLMTIYATTQGNSLAAKGYTVLGLSKGSRLPHSKMEHISVKELEQTKRLIMEIERQSRSLRRSNN
jgi:tripeptide aminopeptidase